MGDRWLVMAKIDPDKENSSIRYGWITAGDGNEYRVARGGFGPRGKKMFDLVSEVSEHVKNNESNLCFEKIPVLFMTAMDPFYSQERISALIDDDHFGWAEYGVLVSIIYGDDLSDMEKKTSLG